MLLESDAPMPMRTRILLAAFGWLLLLNGAQAQTVETLASANLYEPYAVAVDARTNLYYFTDSANGRVVRLSAAGGKPTTLGDGLMAGPQGIVLTKSGLVVAEPVANRLSLMSLEGEVSLFAGGTRGSGDGKGAAAQFNAPAGLAADDAGNVFVADVKNNSIRKVTPQGVVTTYAKGFYEPAGVAVGENGALYVTDTRNHQIVLIPSEGANPVVIAGAFRLSGNDDGPGAAALFNGPRGLLWIGGETGLLVADTGNHSIRRVFQKNGAWRVQTFAGRSGEAGLVGGVFADARFNGPVGMAVDLDGNLLVADLYNNALRLMKREQVVLPEITPSSGSYSNSISLSIKSTTPNALFYYATNGVEPSRQSGFTTGLLDLTAGPVALKLRGYQPDFAASQVISNSYSFFVAPLAFDPAGGSFSNDVRVAISTATTGADLRFTTDGSVPTLLSSKWSDSTLSSNVTLRVRGFRPGFEATEIVSNRFDFAVAPIEVFPAGGTFTNEMPISVRTATEGVDLRFTSDGSQPSATSAKWTPTNAINGIIQIKAFKNGYSASTVASNSFRFVVADPVMSPAGLSTNDSVSVSLVSPTLGAQFFYTLDGSEPDRNSSGPVANGGTVSVGRTGILKVRGFKSGFESSAIVSSTFVLKVSTPSISPSGASADNPTDVTLASETPGAKIFWSIDPLDPGVKKGTLYEVGKPISLATSATMRVRAARDGFSDSDISSADFKFTVATPEIQPLNTTNINQVTVSITSTTSLPDGVAGLYLTTDGTEPTSKSFRYTAPFVLTTNAVIKVVGIRKGFTSSAVVSSDIKIKVPNLSMSPNSGYFPNGATVSLALLQARADARIYYTLDGSEPTESSVSYAGPFAVNQVVSSGQDLRLIRARAFAPGTLPSEIVSGQPVQENSIGIPRDMKAGIGSTIVVPVVLNLRTNLTLRSIQFRVEVTPDSPGAKPLASELRGLNSTTNDFIRLAGSSAGNGPAIITYSPYRSGVTSGLAMSAIGTNANLAISDFGTVAMLALSIPSDSKVGQTYKIRVVEPSGTTNALQAKLDLKAMETRTVTVENVPYLVGDTSVGGWYNAGEFGDGSLDNADVNNAFYASLGIRVPYPFSDVFDAMDAYPDDDDGAVGGDGQIRFLDWQRILSRSLKRDAKNWKRVWALGGVRSTASATLPGSPSLPASLSKGFANKDLWFRQAVLSAGVIDQVLPGSAVEVPVSINVRKGGSISGAQFRVEVTPRSGNSSSLAVSFAPAKGMPVPLGGAGLPENQTVVSWPLIPSAAFTPALQSVHTLGYVRFQVPESAKAGDSFAIHFLNPDAAPDANTQYDIESLPGCVWVGVKAQQPAETISDEWKAHYFGSIDDPRAVRDADSDGDGVPNWAEYVAGTSPVKAASKLELSQPEIHRSSAATTVALRWQTVQGRSYIVESSSSLTSGKWATVFEDGAGDGEVHETQVSTASGSTVFYRIRLQP